MARLDHFEPALPDAHPLNQQPTFSHDRATEPFDNGSAQMTWQIASSMNNWALAGCAHNGQKWTAPQIMAQANQYLGGRVAMALTADYDGIGRMTVTGRDRAYYVLRTKHRPVVLGTGALLRSGHYPLGVAFGRYTAGVWDGTRGVNVSDDRFLVYQGWGGRSLETIPPGTWFVGWVHTTTAQGT